MDDDRPGLHLFTIGEFSKVSGLTVKALRFYHEQELLVPAFVDSQTGYRYYDQCQTEVARVIAYLRSVDLPVIEILALLKHGGEQALLDALQRHKTTLQQQIRRQKKAIRSLDQFIHDERQAQTMAQIGDQVQEKQIEPMLVAGIRMKGAYSDCGKGFARIGRGLGRFVCGKPLLLHYDDEYKDGDADFEACMPVRQPKHGPDISMRELPGGRCVCLLHKGPYEQLGRSYAKILNHIKERGYRVIMPTREVYVKGPGMIFKGNPSNYLTEIQMLVEDNAPKEGDRREIAHA